MNGAWPFAKAIGPSQWPPLLWAAPVRVGRLLGMVATVIGKPKSQFGLYEPWSLGALPRPKGGLASRVYVHHDSIIGLKMAR